MPWLELKRRLLPLRPPRPVHPPPTTPPPDPPPAPPQPPLPPLQPPLPLQPRRGSANRREGARARAPAATAHNLRPQPAAHAGGDDGRAHASGGGDGLGRRSPAHPRGGWAAEKNRPLQVILCCSGWAPPGAKTRNQGLQSGPFWGARLGSDAGLSVIPAVMRDHIPVLPSLIERPVCLLPSSRFSSAAAKRIEIVTIYRPVLPVKGPQAAIGLFMIPFFSFSYLSLTYALRLLPDGRPCSTCWE